MEKKRTEYITKIEKFGVPVGTRVVHEKEEDVGKSGKLLCTVPSGGGLFYAKDELTAV